MEARQAELLQLVIEHHVASAEPVGSKFLVSEGNLDWSEATVRNELRALEEAGYLTHPHTSAGRIPTAKGYRFYVDRLDLAADKLPKTTEARLAASVAAETDYETARKQLAKSIVEFSNETALVAFGPDRLYYTGLSNLFQKPDFGEPAARVDISGVFDRCEDCLELFFPSVSETPRFFIGAEHPFGEMLTVLAFRFGKKQDSLFALLGPQRMEYARNWSIIQKARELA